MQITNVKEFPPITKPQALQILERDITGTNKQYKCYSQKPKNCNMYMYNGEPTEPCWFVYVSADEDLMILQGSRVIVISRVTGKILYHGSANDEG